MTAHPDPQSAPTESDENMAAWEAGVQRMKETLQARRPDLFDEAGELRVEEAMRLLQRISSALIRPRLSWTAVDSPVSFRRRRNLTLTRTVA